VGGDAMSGDRRADPLGSGTALSARERAVRRTLLLEGASDLLILGAKLIAGTATSSTAILSDAIHSLADLANNVVALVAIHLAAAPPDREHPYGHRRYESLAVFLLATLLSVLAVELALHSLGGPREVTHQGSSLALMIGVFGVNIALAIWETRRARALDSDLLRADARHTLSDVLVTALVIGGWQLAARGYLWLDTALTLVVSGLILSLAYSLFRRAVPVLVDHVAVDPDALKAAVDSVPGVRTTRRVRSRAGAAAPRIDVVVSVDRELSTEDSHCIADAIEQALRTRFASEEVTVHIEPD
jgi:cation diffusion facilitator family transporter